MSACATNGPGALRLSAPQFLPQIRAHALSFFKAVEAEFFVRGMRVVIRQAQAEQQRIRAENFFELVHNRNRAAFAHQNRLAAKGFFQRAQRGLRLCTRGRNKISLRTVAGLDLQSHRRRTNLLEMSEQGLTVVFRLLIRHDAAVYFGPRPPCNDGFAAFARVAAGEAVDFKRRPRAALFTGSKTAFTE